MTATTDLEGCAFLAAQAKVKSYLASWFQLGKRVCIWGGKQRLLPQPVLQGDRYSQAFEACWAFLMSEHSGDCFLEDTNETIAQLLTQCWDITPCARCQMPIALPCNGLPPIHCPCASLGNWPNFDLPLPRAPINPRTHLLSLQKRLGV
ncbi:hypothetical protein [Parathermosynechococcus lividus]|jgi:hypothetical protein|uniref:Uncharacterized protein n=1 Tax=Parathermosynechococcus lividus PCC 6715 TaxID=1917166 RepID=A0A2D2PYS5_PARLV|nr:hypothetical protein [Thermostichus lividus]ATS17395.1 hypothetical protein BRW62_00010 [Thermostichus lividus PCC 6715]